MLLRIGQPIQPRLRTAPEAAILDGALDLVRRELLARGRLRAAGLVSVDTLIQCLAPAHILGDARFDERLALGNEPLIEIGMLVQKRLLHRPGDRRALGRGLLLEAQLEAVTHQFLLGCRELRRRRTAAQDTEQDQ